MKLTPENYFEDTTRISNSQINNFVSYGKYEDRLLTPDTYEAYRTKKVKFEVNEAIICGKVVDIYYDGTGEKVWEEYEVVGRRSGNNTKQLNGTMKKKVDKMLEWAESFTRFQDFIKDKNTLAQQILTKDLSLTDSEGEVYEIGMKGLPDFINKKQKLIVDLKTSGSLNMVIDNLQFKGQPKLTASYIRQLSGYNEMVGGDYDGALALVTEKGVKWIFIQNSILKDAWNLLERDLIDLVKYKNGDESFNESIFNLEGEEEEEFTL